MSICPICLNRIKMSSPNKKKVKGVWIHKSHKRIKPKEVVHHKVVKRAAIE